MATGAFDDLPGAGQPLPMNENPFEAMSGDAMAHRVLRNAGCAPSWVEQGKAIRAALVTARATLALSWARCQPVWPPPPHMSAERHGCGEPQRRPAAEAGGASVTDRQPTAIDATESGASAAASGAGLLPRDAGGGWRVYRQPSFDGVSPVQADAPAATTSTTATTATTATIATATTPAEAQAEADTAAELRAREVREAAEHGRRPVEWESALDAFHQEMVSINKLIDTYNLAVPAAWQGVARINPERELRRALVESPQRAAELRTARSASLSRATDSTTSVSAAAIGVIGGSPTWALKDGPMFPGLLDALRSALFARG